MQEGLIPPDQETVQACGEDSKFDALIQRHGLYAQPQLLHRLLFLVRTALKQHDKGGDAVREFQAAGWGKLNVQA